MEKVQIKQEEENEVVTKKKSACDQALSEMKKGSSSSGSSKTGDLGMVDDRDDASMDDVSSHRGGSEDDRDESIGSKKSYPKPSPSCKKGKKISIQPSSSFGQEGYYAPYTQMPPGRGGHYPPHGMHRGPPPPHGHGGPYSHPPPVYYNGGNGGGHHDHYRGHPPPSHYHQMPPPLPHPGQPNHYGGPSGPYSHPPGMASRPGPPPHGYHPSGYGIPYPGPPPPVGYHGGQQAPYPANGNSDSSSVSSSRSKRSSKSQSSSNKSRKKRTIDGIDGTKDNSNLPLAYSFRRTNSSSSNSTLTTAKNTTDNSTIMDSPHKQPERAPSRTPNYLEALEQTNNNIFDRERGHRRSHSGTSTASSLSVGGFSLSSYDGPKADGVVDDIPMLKASPKRRKGDDSAPLRVGSTNESSIFKRKGGRLAETSDQSIDGAESNRFGQLTMNDGQSKKDNAAQQNLFLTLSTSPINHPDETPISKNTKKKGGRMTVKTDMDEDFVAHKMDTPTPPTLGVQTDMADEHTLHKHLRGQTFTPLPHSSDNGISPSNAAFSALAPSLSWSIAGDTPSLEDLAGCSWEDTDRDERKRPGSTTSQMSAATRNMVISPHNFSLWKEEHESKKNDDDDDDDDDDMKDDGETIRLSMLSPNSEFLDGHGGTTTPLPIFFRERGSDERENLHSDKKAGHGKDLSGKDHISEHMQPKNMFMQNPPRRPPHFFSHGPPRDGLPPTPVFAGNKPPTPHFHGSSMGFARSPLHGDRRDFGHMYGHHPPPGHPNDRIRNLRGRMPHGAHMAPLPIHIPPPMSSHHPLTSPMGLPGRHPWSPHGAMPPQMASPHHMSPIDMSQSKRKCMPLKPPIPSKFQGDMDKMKSATVPEFTSLVNFPAHMSQKQSVNLPEGMRCCVMCGSACHCSNGNKKKPSSGLGKKDGMSRGNSAELSDKNGYVIIPTQNKGLCTLCDVNVWVVCTSGLEIKWCKGCKNFRPWAAFGDKGLATKCLRCRERQREKYALQKDEKEKTRMMKNKAKV